MVCFHRINWIDIIIFVDDSLSWIKSKKTIEINRNKYHFLFPISQFKYFIKKIIKITFYYLFILLWNIVIISAINARTILFSKKLNILSFGQRK
jgi:hypothetical protein